MPSFREAENLSALSSLGYAPRPSVNISSADGSPQMPGGDAAAVWGGIFSLRGVPLCNWDAPHFLRGTPLFKKASPQSIRVAPHFIKVAPLLAKNLPQIARVSPLGVRGAPPAAELSTHFVGKQRFMQKPLGFTPPPFAP